MPELPEVESTRLALVPELEGHRIVGVEVGRDRMLRRQPNPRDFEGRLVGRIIRRLDRHGKFLLARLSRDITWVTHLGMSGRVSMAAMSEERVPHTNVVVRVGGGREFRLIDPRTFGFVAAYLPEELAESSIGRLGPDALTGLPAAPALARSFEGRTAPIKAVLLDQTVIAGLGNIYADEALHRAAIGPHRPAGSLEPEEVRRLRSAIRATLATGLRHGGTTLDDLAYLLPDGRAGEYVDRLLVYGREGAGCLRCGRPIRRDVIRQRSSFWCPSCQV